MPPEICPNCGAEVPPKARACPECGADEATGWSEEAHASGLDLPDEDFDYNDGQYSFQCSGATSGPTSVLLVN